MITLNPGKVLEIAGADAELRHRMRYLTATLRLPFLSPALDVVVEDGIVTAVQPAGIGGAYVFTGPQDYWDGAFAKERRPGFESLTSGLSRGARVDGATAEIVAAYQGGFGRLLEVLRETLYGDEAVQLPAEPFKETDNAVGRYKYVTANGVEARVFYEEAGEGTLTLIMQHTAGGDGRQYRNVLANPELQRRVRMIAYDLPFHGRSVPPTGTRWWEQNYKTSKEELMNWAVAIAAAIGLDRPIFMGCSVGGNLALDLAAHHGDSFSAFISLNGWYVNEAPPGFNNDPFRHPLLSRDRFAALCLGATAPGAPEPFRQEIYWNYSSNGPGVYAGDNDYFMGGHDLRKDGHLINTKKTPVYLLAGEYDHTAFDTERGGTAAERNIPGLVYKVMQGLSHFAPTDDPVGFGKELVPVLDEILAKRN